MTKNRTYSPFVLFVVVAFFLSMTACSQTATDTPVSEAATNAPTATATAQPTATPTETASLTPSATLAPTDTPLPTATETSTATPTPELPVGLNTAVPLPSEPITAENASRIVELARYGSLGVWGVQLTGDGSKLYASTINGLMVFDASTQKLLNNIDAIADFSLNYDGSRVLLETETDIRMYDQNGTLLRVVFDIPDDTTDCFRPSADLSPDGKLAAVGYNIREKYVNHAHLEVFQVDTGEVVFSERGIKPVFSPDGSRLAVEFDGSVVIFDTATWEKVTHLSLWMIYDADWTFSPDGSLMAIASPERVEIWDIANRKAIRSIDGYEHDKWGSAASVRWSPNGELIGISANCALSVWEIDTGEQINREILEPWATFVLNDQGGIDVLSISLDTAIAFSMYEHRNLGIVNKESLVITGDYYNGEIIGEACTISLQGAGGSCLTDSTSKYVLGEDGYIYSLFDAGDHSELRLGNETIMNIDNQDGYSLAPIYLDAEVFLYTQSSQYNVYIHRLNRVEQKSTSYYLSGFLAGRHVLPGANRIAVFTSIGIMSVTGYKLSVFDENLRLIYQDDKRNYSAWRDSSLAIEPSGLILAFAERIIDADGYYINRLRYLDLETDKYIADFDLGMTRDDKVSALLFSPDRSMIAVGTYSGRLILLEAVSGVTIRDWQAHKASIANIGFSEDSSMLTTSANDGFVKIWGVWP